MIRLLILIFFAGISHVYSKEVRCYNMNGEYIGNITIQTSDNVKDIELSVNELINYPNNCHASKLILNTQNNFIPLNDINEQIYKYMQSDFSLIVNNYKPM